MDRRRFLYGGSWTTPHGHFPHFGFFRRCAGSLDFGRTGGAVMRLEARGMEARLSGKGCKGQERREPWAHGAPIRIAECVSLRR